ncbi:hypothetical protein QNA27_11795 [Pantoea eucalypti]|uniref:hypothetical protein n=1 Tax=Pantoea eucalypti TaxID=470933 RepID=UPI0024BAD0E9|nr:hypothetical protein [Pantoea eucalypti]MDJ0474340.1 hypothetical protein [Pantoea eucalypti]
MFLKPAQLPLKDPQLGELAKLQILNESEQLFGGRDLTFRIANEIIYCDKGPMVSVIQCGDKKDCLVLLSEGSQKSWECFMYEMAHEAVHLLNPQNNSASYLEEGVAVWFSLEMCKKHSLSHKQPTGKYRQAYDLLSKFPVDVPTLVKTIRLNFPNLTDITADELLSTYPSLTNLDAKRLVNRMVYKSTSSHF